MNLTIFVSCAASQAISTFQKMNLKKTKIYFLVPYPTQLAPGQRFRFEHFLPYFDQYRVKYKISSFMTPAFYKILDKKGRYVKKAILTVWGYLKRGIDILKIITFGYTIIFIYREATPFRWVFTEKILFWLGKKIIYDFDDAIFLPPLHVDYKFLNYFKNPNKVKKIIQYSHLILTGNQYLKDYALQFNSHVFVFPTLIETNTYIPMKKVSSSSSPICIGWTGSMYTLPYLLCLEEVFKEISKKYPHVYFKIIGGKSPHWPEIPLKHIPWIRESEVSDLNEFDMGLMPMTHDPFSQGKCGFKALAYMSLEIPALCSPVGVNTKIVQDGTNGFLCKTPEEWFEKMELLILNPDLRKQIGNQGRKTVLKNYSVEKHKEIFFKHIQSLDLTP